MDKPNSLDKAGWYMRIDDAAANKKIERITKLRSLIQLPLKTAKQLVDRMIAENTVEHLCDEPSAWGQALVAPLASVGIVLFYHDPHTEAKARFREAVMKQRMDALRACKKSLRAALIATDIDTRKTSAETALTNAKTLEILCTIPLE